MRLRICLALALLLCGPLAHAQTASDAAVKYFATLKRKDYDAVAAMYLPAALAEFRKTMSFVAEFPEDEQDGIYASFFGADAGKESIAKLSDVQFFAAFLAAQANGLEAGTQEGLALGDVKVLGEIAEGPNVAHVVARGKGKVGDSDIETLQVLSFTKSNGTWRALLSGELKAIPQQLRSALGR
ncbi:MAG TPA: hypothetical protein VFX89_17695 [Gammaproteobacteria bacterium]|nr:hypothetical protein [Gammaproteobacteria bacterium]